VNDVTDSLQSVTFQIRPSPYLDVYSNEPSAGFNSVNQGRVQPKAQVVREKYHTPQRPLIVKGHTDPTLILHNIYKSLRHYDCKSNE